MKWVLDENFAIPFGLGILMGRFIDNVWTLLASAVLVMSVLFLVKWLLKRKNKSFHFPTKDFLILSLLILFFERSIDSPWLYLAFVCVVFFIRWLLKQMTESEPEKV